MVRIGVTGHRSLAEIPKLITGIGQVLDWIDNTLPNQSWSILSSLAEGADRLVVEQVLIHQPSTRLVVPLPLLPEDFQADFSGAESRQEFLRLVNLADEVILPTACADSREEAYWTAGKYILEQSTVLIALWDGKSAQGKGGTGDMVASARERGLPMAWVHCDNRSPGTNQATSLGEDQGRVSFERL